MIERSGLQEPPHCEHDADFISVQELATFSQANCRRPEELYRHWKHNQFSAEKRGLNSSCEVVTMQGKLNIQSH